MHPHIDCEEIRLLASLFAIEFHHLQNPYQQQAPEFKPIIPQPSRIENNPLASLPWISQTTSVAGPITTANKQGSLRIHASDLTPCPPSAFGIGFPSLHIIRVRNTSQTTTFPSWSPLANLPYITTQQTDVLTWSHQPSCWINKEYLLHYLTWPKTVSSLEWHSGFLPTITSYWVSVFLSLIAPLEHLTMVAFTSLPTHSSNRRTDVASLKNASHLEIWNLQRLDILLVHV